MCPQQNSSLLDVGISKWSCSYSNALKSRYIPWIGLRSTFRLRSSHLAINLSNEGERQYLVESRFWTYCRRSVASFLLEKKALNRKTCSFFASAPATTKLQGTCTSFS